MDKKLLVILILLVLLVIIITPTNCTPSKQRLVPRTVINWEKQGVYGRKKKQEGVEVEENKGKQKQKKMR
jgi:hypothetical protein